MKLARRSRHCRRLAPRLSAALDGGPVDLEMRRHLRSCSACRRQFLEYRRVRGVLRTLGHRVPAPQPRATRRRDRRTAIVLSGAAGGVSLLTIVLAQRRRSR